MSIFDIFGNPYHDDMEKIRDDLKKYKLSPQYEIKSDGANFDTDDFKRLFGLDDIRKENKFLKNSITELVTAILEDGDSDNIENTAITIRNLSIKMGIIDSGDF